MLNQLKSRRGFIKTLFKGITSLFAFSSFSKVLRSETLAIDPRVRIPNPFIAPNGKPILVCVEGDNYWEMLDVGLQALGGLDRLIDNNQDILIKPNLVYTEEYPTTSSVDSIASTIEAVRSVTSGVINVGDKGGSGDLEIYEYLNLEPAVTQAGGNLIAFSDTYDVRRDSWDPNIPDFMVYTDIYDAPILINLCSLKRHYAAFLTCAIKHHVGAVSGPIRQNTREYLHSLPDNSPEFLQTIPEIAGLINSELTIVDARSIMAINGPLLMYGGEIREMGKIVISGDMLATEVYCAGLMAENDETFDPNTIIPTLERADELGLGTSDLSQVEIIEFMVNIKDDFRNNLRPDKFELSQNYPNPFNMSTNIKFALPESSNITLKVYDMLGREIKTLADGFYTAGIHSVRFDGGRQASGIYYYRLTTPNYMQKRAMVLLK